MSSFDGFTIAVIIVISIVGIVPITFFALLTRRLCCDQQLRHYFEKADRTLEMEDNNNDNDDDEDKPPPVIMLSFRQVRYTVPLLDGSQKHILAGVSAYFKPGTLTAIMGPSGCGKSTLLDVIADQKNFGTISGDIRINGALRTSLFRRAMAYVQQFDVLYPELTPRETLFFVTELRLGNRESASKKYRRVQKTLDELDLSHVADTRIGSGESSGGLSGGQKRRVTVAIELVTEPSLILLDEPTSGLDAYGSLKLVQVLRKLADSGRTIACTIHQPRSDIFKMFDNLLLIKLGRTMYFGPVNEIFPYFESLGIKVDYSVNPADFIVDLTRDKTPEEEEEEEMLKALGEQQVGEQQDGDLVRKRGLSGIAESEEADEDAQDENGEEDGNFVPNTSIALEATNAAKDNVNTGPALSKPMIDLDSLVDSYGVSEIRREHHRLLFSVYKGTYPNMPATLEDFYGTSSNDGEKTNSGNQRYATTFWQQTSTLARRSIVNDMRNSSYVIGNWVIGPIMMLFYGALYSNISAPQSSTAIASLQTGLTNMEACNLDDTFLKKYNYDDNVFSVESLTSCGQIITDNTALSFVRASLIYQFMAAGYFSEGPFVAQVFLDKRMFFREHSARSYSSGAYHFNFYVRMFFSAFLKGLLFSPLGYFAAQLKIASEPYFLFCIFFGGMSACGSAMALLCASFIPSLEVAQAVFVLINIIAQNLSGYWIPELLIGWWFRWMYYINLFRYAYEGAVLAQKLPEFANYAYVFNPNDPPSRYSDGLTLRSLVWTYALVLVLFASFLQMVAFLVTWLTHISGTTDSNEMLEEDNSEWTEEAFMAPKAPRKTTEQSADGEPEQKGGVKRNGLVDRWRNMQYASTRNVGKGGLQLTLAGNGGVLVGTNADTNL